MTTRFLRLALAGVLFGGCSEPADSGAGAPLFGDGAITTDFSARVVRPGSAPIPPAGAEGGVRRILVQGSVGTPVPCYELRGAATRAGRDITLEVTAVPHPQDVICIQVVATFAYEATIRELAPGSYRIRVVHNVNGTSAAAWEQEVVVQ